MSRFASAVIFGTFLFVYSVNVNAEELTGLVVRIISGDAVVLLDAGRHQHEIRLTQIIAPKKTQPWGARSKQALATMIYHKDVVVYVEGKDKYGRTLGRIYLHGKDINRAMLDQGEAWVYRKYVTDTSLLEDEDYAHHRKLGLFSQPHPIPPWEWRDGFHSQNR